MRTILYIHHGKGLGGAPLSLLQMVLALDRSQFHPVVLFLHDSDAMGLYREHGVEVLGPVNRSDFSHTKIWWYRWWHLGHLIRALWDSYRLWHGEAAVWIRKRNPAIVHLNTSTLLVWGIVARRIGIPVVWHIREPLASGYFGIRRFLVRMIVGHYATVIVPICRNDAVPWRGNSKVFVVYNAVDIERVEQDLVGVERNAVRARFGIGHDVPMLLFMGGWSREKGTPFLLQVFERLQQRLSSVRLVIAGYWNPPQRLKLPVGVVLTGPVKPFAGCFGVGALMSAADCLLFPALTGHFARPVIEAGCLGIPTVATGLPPLDELVSDGQTGFLLPINVNDWVAVLEKLCTDQAQRQRIGNAARPWCRERFSVRYQIQQVEQIYHKILHAHDTQ